MRRTRNLRPKRPVPTPAASPSPATKARWRVPGFGGLLAGFVTVGAIAILVAKLVAGEGEESPQASPPPSGSDATIQQLRQVVLQPMDLPAGFGAPVDGELPREVAGYYAMASRGFVNSDVKRAQTPAVIYNVESWVYQFASPERAKAQMDSWRAVAAEPPSDKPDPRGLSFEGVIRGMTPFEVKANGVQDILALHDIRQPQSTNQQGPRSTTFVFLQRDEFISVVAAVAFERHPATAELEQLVGNAAARLNAEPKP